MIISKIIIVAIDIIMAAIRKETSTDEVWPCQSKDDKGDIIDDSFIISF
jgi:hypothetical protein